MGRGTQLYTSQVCSLDNPLESKEEKQPIVAVEVVEQSLLSQILARDPSTKPNRIRVSLALEWYRIRSRASYLLVVETSTEIVCPDS